MYEYPTAWYAVEQVAVTCISPPLSRAVAFLPFRSLHRRNGMTPFISIVITARTYAKTNTRMPEGVDSGYQSLKLLSKARPSWAV